MIYQDERPGLPYTIALKTITYWRTSDFLYAGARLLSR